MAEALSKSAKKRAAKKARDEAHAEEAAPAAAAPAPPKPEPKAKAKAEAKQAAKPEPKAATAQPKAAAAQPKAAAAQPKAEAKTKKKKEAEPPAPAPPPKSVTDPNYAVVMDDGTGGEWETCSGASKKAQRRAEKTRELEVAEKEREIAEAKAKKAAEKEAKSGGDSKKVDPSTMTATQAAIAKARAQANAPITPADSKEAPVEEKKSLTSVTITVPENKIGRVIGPKGANLKLIQEKTGVSKIDTDQGEFTVLGDDPKGVAQAELAIKEMVEKGYMSLAYDDFQHNDVMAHPSTFPDLIGKGGEVIRKIKEKLAVEVSIPAVPKGVAGAKKYPIGIAGAKENVAKAKECLESIIYYYHHEITHEGKDHVEMEIPGWAYSYVIGKQGSELKHIQNNWDVKVYIPRENSANQNVVVVGAKTDCDRAKTYIDKLVSGADSKGTDKRADKPDDHWGAEEPEEPWMKQYMYKRK